MKWLNRWRQRAVAQTAQRQADEAPLRPDEDPFDEPVVWEITDTIDLHQIAPRDIQAVVKAYLVEAQARGWSRLRIIHGKGLGVQRAQVRCILQETAFVSEFFDAPDASGWGATIVLLQPQKGSDDG